MEGSLYVCALCVGLDRLWASKQTASSLVSSLLAAGHIHQRLTPAHNNTDTNTTPTPTPPQQIVHKMLHAGMSSHPDFQNLRGLGTTYLDPSMEPNRCVCVGGGGQ